MRGLLILLFIFFFQYSYSQDSVYIKNYKIGNAILNVHVTIYYPQNALVTFINLHDDENTSVKAGEDFLSKYGGLLLQLQHGGKRNFNFMIGDETYSFDPNRIFTNKGLKATLLKQSAYKHNAAIEVKKFAESLVKNYVDGRKLVIALHNNTGKGLSVLSYKKGGQEAKNAAKLYINPLMNPHDFIITTKSFFFKYLKQKKINVVLQKANPYDDGSLSVYAAKKKIPYVNVEALHGHLNEQIKMLEALKDIIYRY